MTELILDPEWDRKTLTHSIPRPPQAILAKGTDTIVGYRHDGSGREPERAIAIYNNPEIQAVLDDWLPNYRAERLAKQRAEQDAWLKSVRAKEYRQVAEAKRALGIKERGK